MDNVVTAQPTSNTIPPSAPDLTEVTAQFAEDSDDEEKEKRRQREDCCCYYEPDESDVCCWYYMCRCISDCFYTIGQCSEDMCSGFAECCHNCCESSPDPPAVVDGDSDAGCLDCCSDGGDCGSCDCSS